MIQKAIFAGGCFWCTEHDLREIPGVIDVVSGYTGDTASTASYEQVASHTTKHRESVEVAYDSEKTSFKKLTQFFLDHIDPTDAGGQFHDRGESYKTAIYYQNAEEEKIARSLVQELGESGLYDKPIAVDILPALPFYKAEYYHQQYADKNPSHYASYRRGSGREEFVNNVCIVRDEKKMYWKE
jgi:methionine-S-sulfoxide reductase